MAKMDVKKEIRMKVYIAFTCICLFGIAIVFKAAYIQVTEGTTLRAISNDLQTKFDTIIAERGNILTEDGILLSTSIPEFEVHIDFSVIDSGLFNKKIDTLCICLADLFKDKPAQDYKDEFVRAYNEENQYYLLGKKLKYDQYEALRNFPIFKKGKGSGGFITISKEKREMPYNLLAYRTIGAFRDSNKTGLEKEYDHYLTGENGRRVLRKATGNIWIPLEGTEQEAENGKDVVTTLDLRIQDVAEHALMSVLEKYECTYGTCIVMEVETGKIRAMANLGRQADGTYWEDFNYAMLPTEPGSTFKLATLLSLFKDKKIGADDIVDAENGIKKFGPRTMRDSHLGTTKVPVWKAFAQSSNVAIAKLADMYYKDRPFLFINHLKDFNLNKHTGIDLPGERNPYIESIGSKTWSNTSLPWMATGYEVQISPLHTCMMYNTIANNGKMMKPYLVSAIREYGKDVITINPEVVIPRIADSITLKQLKKCLYAVVQDADGTAKGIRSPFYTIAGKTGTAKVADKGFGYEAGVYQGSFVGYIPAEKPKYTICVVVRTKPMSDYYYGSAIAAPVFRMVADKIFSANMGSWDAPLDSFAHSNSHNAMPAKAATAQSYNIMLNALKRRTLLATEVKGQLMQLTSDSSKNMAIQPAKIFKSIAPDVTGMGLKDAVYFLENNGLKVQVKGKGKVIGQSIAPGTRILKGQNIILQLS